MARLHMSQALERFAKRTPVTVMSRAVIENVISADFVNRIFEDSAERQYTRELLFSSTVELLSPVVFREQDSVRSSYGWWDEPTASLTAIYAKLSGTEPQVCEALVTKTAQRMQSLIKFCHLREEPIRGLRLKYIDGNYLAQTEHRLIKLHGLAVAALPGQTQVVFEHATGLIRQVYCSEDAHQQERALVPRFYNDIEQNQLTLGDTGYCMNPFIEAHENRKAFYLVRHHAGTSLTELKPRKAKGRCSTGKVFECPAVLSKEPDAPQVRAIFIELDTPLKKGQTTLTLITNVPPAKATAKKLAELYRDRWTIEETFRRLTQCLRCEVSTLGYPKAALLGFSIAVLAYNTIAVVEAAVAKAHGAEKAETLSIHKVAKEIACVGCGLDIATDPEDWLPFRSMSPEALARFLVQLAIDIPWQRLTKSPRGPKKPVKHRRYPNGTHLATSRLLDGTPQSRDPIKAAALK
jgi:hypothetical protein